MIEIIIAKIGLTLLLWGLEFGLAMGLYHLIDDEISCSCTLGRWEISLSFMIFWIIFVVMIMGTLATGALIWGHSFIVLNK